MTGGAQITTTTQSTSFAYLEQGDDRGAGSGGFSINNSKSTRKFVTGPIAGANGFGVNGNVANLQKIHLDFLGQTSFGVQTNATNAGGIQRTLPVCDPVWPFLFAESVNGINGVGKQQTLAQNVQVTPNSGSGMSQGSLIFQEYEFNVSYTPRPYRVLPDSAAYIEILNSSNQYYNDAGTAIPSSGDSYFAHEEVRYTDFEIVPAGNDITFKAGSQMRIRGVTGISTVPPDPMYPETVRIRLPDNSIKFTWYQVPYRYVTDINSNLLKFVGRINQRPWFDLKFWTNPASPNFLFPAGSLLYLGFSAVRYTPPFQNQISFGASGPNQYSSYSAEKLCDITLIFAYTTRVNSSSLSGGNPSNKNFIAAGWNCLPWHLTRKFYYSSTQGAGSGATATFTTTSGGAINSVTTTPATGGSGYPASATFNLPVVGPAGSSGGIVAATTNGSGVVTSFNATPVAAGTGYPVSTTVTGAATSGVADYNPADGTQVPYWKSFPFEMLFTDPAVTWQFN